MKMFIPCPGVSRAPIPSAFCVPLQLLHLLPPAGHHRVCIRAIVCECSLGPVCDQRQPLQHQAVPRNHTRQVINHARKSRVRTFIKKVEAAITSGDQAVAREALRVAQPEMQRGVTNGVFHRNTISRKISRLNAQIKAMV